MSSLKCDGGQDCRLCVEWLAIHAAKPHGTVVEEQPFTPVRLKAIHVAKPHGTVAEVPLFTPVWLALPSFRIL